MALILALNPGNSHSPTLSRLARELHGCELIGAESCVVAISAIKKRVPDIVLLPAREARGEADLIAHLESVPGGVLTLKLPPVESANPVDLARQIREMLTGVSASADVGVPGFGSATPDADMPVGTSPHLLAAATAAITWIRGRRAQWIEERPGDISPEPLPQWTGVSRSESDKPYEPIESLPKVTNPTSLSNSTNPKHTTILTRPMIFKAAPPDRPSFKRGCRARPPWRPSSASRPPWCPTGRRFAADSAARPIKPTHRARFHQQPM